MLNLLNSATLRSLPRVVAINFTAVPLNICRIDALDAAVWNSGDKPHKAYNTFGGSLGGPLQLPKLSRGEAKTFFFADFEANRRRFSTPLFLFVPTNAMRQPAISPALSTPLLDPFTGKPYPGNQIPSGSALHLLAGLHQSRRRTVCSATISLHQTSTSPLPISARRPTTSSKLPRPATPTVSTCAFDRTITSKQSMFVRWSWKHLSAQSLTDTALNTVNNFLPPDQDAEHNNNLLVSHNYLITSHLVNEARFGVSLWQFQVKFPIQGASAISTLGLNGLDLSDHPVHWSVSHLQFQRRPR